MRSAATPWAIGAISLAGEFALCVHLMAILKPAYAPGEGAFLLGVIPAVLTLFYCYHLVQLVNQWSHCTLPKVQCTLAMTFHVAGSFFGLGGLWLAAKAGAHAAPFFVVWALLSQLAAVWLARRSLR